mgnify:CR=1 FL=1
MDDLLKEAIADAKAVRETALENAKMALESLGLLGLFLATFLSATILPFSSEAIVLFFLAKGVDPTICLSIATLGNSLGGASNYFIGRLGNPLWLKRIGVKENTITKNEKCDQLINYYCCMHFHNLDDFLYDLKNLLVYTQVYQIKFLFHLF